MKLYFSQIFHNILTQVRKCSCFQIENKSIFVCLYANELDYFFLYCEGDKPTCSLKYLPRKDCVGKLRSLAISLMLFEEFFSKTLISSVT